MPTPMSHGTVGLIVRALSVARALRRQGCDVRFSVGEPYAAMVEADGFRWYSIPLPVAAGTQEPLNSVADSLRWTGMAAPEYVDALIDAELATYREFRPHGAWAEFRPTAAISAAAAGVRLAANAGWPVHPDFPANHGPDPTAETFSRHCRRFGLPPVVRSAELAFVRSDLPLAPSVPELEPELAPVRGVAFYGHTVDREWQTVPLPEWYVGWRGDDPLIFVYLSVTGLEPALYAEILVDAFDRSPYRVLCATGYHFALHELPPSTARVRFEWFVPARIIADASVVISPAGHDTILHALYHAVPMVSVPGVAYEREYYAQQLARLGVGLTLSIAAFRPSRLRQAVERVTDVSFTGRCRLVSAGLRALGGPDAAARLMRKMITTAHAGAQL
ncbi:MAG: glycosyltransferase [bacterium]